MRVGDLKARGGFSGADVIRKTIEWTHEDPDTGEEVMDQFDVFVRLKMTFGDVDRIFVAPQANVALSRTAALIAARIRLGDDASEQMSYEEADNLEPKLAALFINAINAVDEAKPAAEQVPKN